MVVWVAGVVPLAPWGGASPFAAFALVELLAGPTLFPHYWLRPVLDCLLSRCERSGGDSPDILGIARYWLDYRCRAVVSRLSPLQFIVPGSPRDASCRVFSVPRQDDGWCCARVVPITPMCVLSVSSLRPSRHHGASIPADIRRRGVAVVSDIGLRVLVAGANRPGSLAGRSVGWLVIGRRFRCVAVSEFV